MIWENKQELPEVSQQNSRENLILWYTVQTKSKAGHKEKTQYKIQYRTVSILTVAEE